MGFLKPKAPSVIEQTAPPAPPPPPPTPASAPAQLAGNAAVQAAAAATGPAGSFNGTVTSSGQGQPILGAPTPATAQQQLLGQ